MAGGISPAGHRAFVEVLRWLLPRLVIVRRCSLTAAVASLAHIGAQVWAVEKIALGARLELAT
jgi:hypothetical protein